MFQSSPLRRALPGTATFAFITHSPITLPNNLPPDVDNEPLARRRRRRTSQHDQSILEEEYGLNDRPDKYARREIMKRVDLGEREIQIWFQNRRQTSRRKSKPLLPHDLSTPNSKSRFDLSSDCVMSSDIGLTSDAFDMEDTNHRITPSSRPSSPVRNIYCNQNMPDTNSPTASRSMDDDKQMQTEPDTRVEPGILFTPGVRNSIASINDAESKTSPIHFLLNVDQEPMLPTLNSNEESTILGQTQIPQSSPYPSLTTPSESIVPLTPSPCGETVASRRRTQGSIRQPQLLKRSSSMIRLAMSMEGKATVIMEDEIETLPTSTSSSQASIQSTSSSAPERRVVDAKVWEICCDSQSSTPTNKVLDDSPRKTLKIIRARQVVAAAKEAATKRKKKTQLSSTPSKILKTKQENPILAPKPSNKPLKAKAPTRLSEKLKVQARKSAPNTPKKPKGDVKLQKPSLTSPLKLVESPFRLYSENNNEDSPRKQLKSREGADSDKENFDPDGRYMHQSVKEGKIQERRILGNIAPDVAAGEMECIENLLSLRGAMWV